MHPQSDDSVLVGAVEEVNWDNAYNGAFYEHLSVDSLKIFAEKAGLASGCDMELLTPYWSTAKSILEVGAGYGRVIDYLFRHGFQGKITALERCKAFASYLKNKFGQHEKISLLTGDVLYLNNIEDRFDLIVMLWSGITDFLPHEQLTVIKNLAEVLKNEGKLVLEMLSGDTTPLLSRKYAPQYYSLTAGEYSVYGFCPTISEMKEYAKAAGLVNVKLIRYKTNTFRERWLYVLS